MEEEREWRSSRVAAISSIRHANVEFPWQGRNNAIEGVLLKAEWTQQRSGRQKCWNLTFRRFAVSLQTFVVEAGGSSASNSLRFDTSILL